MELIRSKWSEILSTLREDFSIADLAFNTWIKPLEPFSVDNNELKLVYNNTDTDGALALPLLERKYSMPIKTTIAELIGREYEIKFILPKKDDNYIEEKNQIQSFDKTDYESTGLNPRLTFDNFVVGGSNKFAQTASFAVADSPGESYNPLFIYGGPGLGKTHLLHAIGNYIVSQNKTAKVIYVPAESFLNEVMENMRDSKDSSTKMKKIRDKYRTVDILMVDDIQVIIGKEATQNEFFNTFNVLYQLGKQIVITSDRPPKEMENLDERFKTRFTMGIMADIGHPDYETRKAIILNKTEEMNFKISDEVTDYIAENIKTSIREIEGAIKTLHASYLFEHEDITLDFAKIKLADFIFPNNKREITPQLVIEVVAEHFGLSVDQMASKNRSSSVARPRQIAMYLCKEMTDTSLEAVGVLLGGRDHSTIIHGSKKIGEEYTSDGQVRNTIDIIKKKIVNN